MREQRRSNCSFTKQLAVLKVIKAQKKIVQNSETDKTAA
jgi:hypothetical protein